MVMPLIDEFKPKCYVCNKPFQSIEDLREHQKTQHVDFVNFHENQKREPAPGDVTVF
jgi:ribosomal protein L34E